MPILPASQRPSYLTYCPMPRSADLSAQAALKLPIVLDNSVYDHPFLIREYHRGGTLVFEGVMAKAWTVHHPSLLTSK